MKNYADHEFYMNEYKQGSLSGDLFYKFIVEASREIDKYVNRELNDYVLEHLTERQKWQLQYTACMLCDYLQSNGSITKGSTSEGTSISIDGVSISNNSSSGDTGVSSLQEKKKIVMDNLPQELTRYL